MISFSRRAARHALAPEVIQSSDMDCGPAALKCLFDGFAIPVSYGRLREACQTDVDGTSIDELERVAAQLGLAAEQIVIPADHLPLAAARSLPAIVVVDAGNGVPHFVVCWHNHAGLLQLMDPATGRRWVPARRFLEEVFAHCVSEPATSWRAWSGSPSFLLPLRQRLRNLGSTRSCSDELVAAALDDPSWVGLAALDAATRLAAALVRSGGLRRGTQATRTIRRLAQQAAAAPDTATAVIPDPYWAVRPLPASDDADEDAELLLEMRVAVLLRVRGRGTLGDFAEKEHAAHDYVPPPPPSPDLLAAMHEAPARPSRDVLRFLRPDGWQNPLILLGALLLAAGGLVVEVLLLRALLDMGTLLGLTVERLGMLAAVLLFLVLLLLLELPLNMGLLRMGRHLEARLRVAFLAKIPRLGDRYFQSRLTSDMAERSHSLYRIRLLPLLGGQALMSICTIVLTVGGIIWLDPGSAPLALLAGALAIGLPLVGQAALNEHDLRIRTYVGALSRFVFDALLGLLPIQAHGAERAVQREHERLLTQWVRASRQFLHRALLLEGIQMILGFGLAIALLLAALGRSAALDEALLLVYWALSLPLLGQELVLLGRQYPTYRTITLRLLEPLGAREHGSAPGPAPPAAPASGAAISFAQVQVQAAGHTILTDINLSIAAGSHIAIVGPSGAGKSSLVGVLLGWHRPAEGHVSVDGAPLEGAALAALRQQTAWIDPAIHLWNTSLLENLTYGIPPDQPVLPGRAVADADLRGVLTSLPDGMQTRLGEGGGLLSGGEGQRVRFGRALTRPAVRLVILDEPFRGLDREQRRLLLQRARQIWQAATLICISHDISAVQDVERVVVLEQGRIVEDGAPADLAANADSHFAHLLRAEGGVQRHLWVHPDWRRIRMQRGQVTPGPDGPHADE